MASTIHEALGSGDTFSNDKGEMSVLAVRSKVGRCTLTPLEIPVESAWIQLLKT